MKREILLEKEEYMRTVKSRRLHFCTTPAVSEEINSYSKKLELCKSDVIVLSALSFQVENISKKLDTVLNMLQVPAPQISEIKKVQVKRLVKKYKGENTMSEDNKKEEGKTGQFHLRVTPEAYEEIKKKANEFGMTISDYITFVTLHFDVMEISEKIDEISTKLNDMQKGK